MKMTPAEIAERSRKLSDQLQAVMDAAARDDWETVARIGAEIEDDFAEVKTILSATVH